MGTTKHIPAGCQSLFQAFAYHILLTTHSVTHSLRTTACSRFTQANLFTSVKDSRQTIFKMRFFASVSLYLAFAASAIAQTADFNPIYTPTEGAEVPAGSTFEITWQAPAKYKDQTVSISLIGGASQGTLVPIADIAGGIQNSAESYQWAVDASLGAENTYGLVMKLESNPEIFQYSFPFKIVKGDNDDSEETKAPEDGAGKPTHIVATATGIKTVTLTSCPPETTSTWSSSSTSTQQWNTTVVISTPLPPPATSTALGTPEPIPTPEPTTVPSEVPVAAGAHLVADPIALVGGLIVALAL